MSNASVLRLDRRLYNRPMAILPSYLSDTSPADALPLLAAEAHGALAIIPIQGVLVHGASLPDWGMTGYVNIRRDFDAAMADGTIGAVALLIDSPGGQVAGCFELADHIFASRGGKPIVSVLNTDAYSAAYALACAADAVVVPETGGTGSIGCIAIHADMTAMMASVGIKSTLIRSSPFKMEGNPLEPLSEATQGRMQADIDALAEMFFARVATCRGLSVDQVRDQQALTFLGQRGVDAGLADAVSDPGPALQAILQDLA